MQYCVSLSRSLQNQRKSGEREIRRAKRAGAGIAEIAGMAEMVQIAQIAEIAGMAEIAGIAFEGVPRSGTGPAPDPTPIPCIFILFHAAGAESRTLACPDSYAAAAN